MEYSSLRGFSSKDQKKLQVIFPGLTSFSSAATNLGNTYALSYLASIIKAALCAKNSCQVNEEGSDFDIRYTQNEENNFLVSNFTSNKSYAQSIISASGPREIVNFSNAERIFVVVGENKAELKDKLSKLKSDVSKNYALYYLAQELFNDYMKQTHIVDKSCDHHW